MADTRYTPGQEKTIKTLDKPLLLQQVLVRENFYAYENCVGLKRCAGSRGKAVSKQS